MRITVTDMRAAGHCPGGIKTWFDQQGLDFRDMLKNGIEEEAFLATRDARAEKVVALKREREPRG